MAWTSPMTFTSGSVLTAAQLNANLRDNLNETAAAKASTVGGLFVAQGANTLVERVPQEVFVSTQETTTTTFYDELSNHLNITATTSTMALVGVTSRMYNSTVDAICLASFQVSGASSLSPADSYAVQVTSSTVNARGRSTALTLLTTLTAGSNVFKMVHKVSAGTMSVADRRLFVLPL